ncbi:MAG TPA: BTAD domain-containing putative transcriptional regulator, partial [Blastocatellia bacterium]|nr:BTAD domain-containing putative transcriptional regulator [Blastocatellia bacterium]
MPTLSVLLFGKFSIRYRDQVLEGLDVRKAQELLSYLLLFRGRSHSREALASLLWGDTSTAQSRKYLRKALWQLQNGLKTLGGGDAPLLLVDQEWIGLDGLSELWLDVAAFEEAYAAAGDTPGHKLDPTEAGALEKAAALYSGDLLLGWYQDWCLYERERLQNMYLMILDKLIGYCDANRKYEAGLAYGSTI